MNRSVEDPSGDHWTIESLYRISSLLGQIDDPRLALEQILRELVEVFQANSASVALINPETKRLVIECCHGVQDGPGNFELPLGIGVTGWVALHGKTLLVPDTLRDSRYIPLREGVRSELAAPMEDRGQVIGVVNVDSDRPGAFGERHRRLLVLLTREATRVVTQLWLMRQLKAKADQLEALINVGGTIISKREVRSIISNITAEARRLMGCSMAALFLYREGSGTLELESLQSADGPVPHQESLPLRETSLGTVIAHHRPVEVLDLSRTEEHHFVSLIQKQGLISMLAVPIVFEKDSIGVLSTYTTEFHRFNNDEKRLLSALAGLGAVAIENSRLYSRIFESEERLRQNEKLTTLGMLTSEIAHEIRNPLTVIQLLFNSLKLEFDAHDMRGRDLEVIREKLSQLNDIVGRVLSFGRPRQSVMANWDLDSLISETFQLIRLKLHQGGIGIDYQPSGSPLIVYGNKGQLQQVFLNLFINATEAMKKGGRIQVRTLADADGRPTVEIADTGKGIPDELQNRIFESFLSDKSEGTGLGLSIVKRILRSHRGDIELASSSPEGTVFRLWLPPGESETDD